LTGKVDVRGGGRGSKSKKGVISMSGNSSDGIRQNHSGGLREGTPCNLYLCLGLERYLAYISIDVKILFGDK